MPESQSVDRRDFLKASRRRRRRGGASPPPAYARVYGANERIGVGFVGVGGRCQAHLDIITKTAARRARASPPSPSATSGTATRPTT